MGWLHHIHISKNGKSFAEIDGMMDDMSWFLLDAIGDNQIRDNLNLP